MGRRRRAAKKERKRRIREGAEQLSTLTIYKMSKRRVL